MKRIRSIFLVLAVILSTMSYNSQGVNAASTVVNFPDTTSSAAQSKTVTLPAGAVVTSVTTDNGTVSYVKSGNNVTVTVSGGSVTSTTTPSKTVTSYTDQLANNTFSVTKAYNDGTYSGTLNASGAPTVISGTYTPAVTKTYTATRDWTSIDYCIWRKSIWTMVYQTSTGSPPAASTTDNGVTINLSPSSTWQLGVSYTKYAARDMDKYRGTDGYPDEPWIGSSYVVDGQTYLTAYHYMRTSYSGSYTFPASDTRTWRQNYSGTVYGATVNNYVYNVTINYTISLLPTVTTQAVTNITATTAIGNGNVTSLGVPNPTQHGFVWSTTTNPTVALATKTTLGPKSITGAFTSNIAGLAPGVKYYVRAYAINSAGIAYGNEVSFITDSPPTVIATDPVDGATGVAINKVITVTFSENVIQGMGPWDQISVKDAAGNPVAITKSLSGAVLTINHAANFLYNTKYIVTIPAGAVKDNAFNELASTYTFSFTTLSPSLAVTTLPATNIKIDSALLNGDITSLGLTNPTEHGFVWSTTLTPTLESNLGRTALGSTSTTGTFNSNATGLASGRRYYFRAYAIDSSGPVYGFAKSFVTLRKPTVSTLPVSGTTGPSATLNGRITSLGIPNPTQHGFVWSTTLNPTLESNIGSTSLGLRSTTGTFASVINELTADTTYHVRAYAINDAGTVYGIDVSFIAGRPTVTTQAATNITEIKAKANGTLTGFGSSNPTHHGFVWSKFSNPLLNSPSASKVDLGTKDSLGTFSSEVTGLMPGTTYYIKAYAENSVGITYGNEMRFTTASPPISNVEHNQDIKSVVVSAPPTAASVADFDSDPSIVPRYKPYNLAQKNMFNIYKGPLLNGDYFKYRVEFNVTNPTNIKNVEAILSPNNTHLLDVVSMDLTKARLLHWTGINYEEINNNLTINSDNSINTGDVIASNGAGWYIIEYSGIINIQTANPGLTQTMVNHVDIKVITNSGLLVPINLPAGDYDINSLISTARIKSI